MTSVTFLDIGMQAALTVSVAVARSRRPRRCESCGRKRVAFALTFTRGALGNPEHPWKCAQCWGLR